jgi:hypothetical protein
MGIDDFKSDGETVRNVWENKNGSKVTTVTSFLLTGKYEVNYKKDDDGSVYLKYTPIDDSD